MNVDTMYLTAFLVIGGIIFIVLVLPLCSFLPMVVRQSFGSQDFIGAIVFNAYP